MRMRFVCCVFVFAFAFALCADLVAQPVTFVEEFTDNSNGWWLGDNELGSAVIERGRYVMVCKQEQAWWYTNRSTYIDPNKDYTIEATLRQTGGAVDGVLGLVFGVADRQNLNALMFKSNGSARVATAENDAWIDHRPWEVAPSVKGLGVFNTLTVERRGSKMHYRINGAEVATSPLVRMFGLDIGVVASDTMRLEIERITVRQEQKIRIVPGAPRSITKTNLGPNVNSEYDEMGPVISHDGKTLYFSVNYHPENEGGVADADEIWYAEAVSDTKWGKRKRMQRPLNTVQANWVISVTPDNNSLLVANLYNPDGSPKGSGISLSQRTATGWSVPEQVYINDFINNSGWQQFGLSSDRKVLLLSITGNPTLGDHDLYVSFLQNDGTWSSPKNLGTVVNTMGDEASPFLAADGATLYYSTNGLPGFGQNDIYVTRRLDDTWLKWSEPENLGPAINTPASESYFTVPASGTYAYMNSTFKSLGKTDIFRLALPAALRPHAVVLVYGNVLNSKTKAPLGANITYRDLASDAEIGVASSDPTTGAYKIVLPAEKVYSFMAGLDGYYAVSDNLDVKGLTGYREIKRDLLLTPIEVGATIRLNNIFFDFAKSELRSESFPELKRAVAFLNENPNVAVEVSGHTDNVGTEEDNRALSETRAQAVLDYLTREGIPSARLTSKGFGESNPVASNASESGRQMNRRVELKIIRQ